MLKNNVIYINLLNNNMAKITDPVKLRKIAERNESLGFGNIKSQDGIDRYVRGEGTTSTDPTRGAGTGFDIGASITSNVNAVTGSSDVRDEKTKVKTDATGLRDDITKVEDTVTVDDIKRDIGWRDPNAAFTAGEQASIDRQAEEAGAKYDELIATAEESKRVGFPKAMIGAGEGGGFMSTQLAGAGALAPTEGGTFAGAGGELERVKSVYDRNIQNMQASQKRAMAAARAKAEEAIRTGKSQDNEDAQALFKLAQEANLKAVNLAQARVDLIDSYEKSKEGRIEFGQEQEDRAIGQKASSIVNSLVEGDPQANYDKILKEADLLGIDPEVLLGSVNKLVQEQQQILFEKGEDIFDIAKDLEEGTSYTMPDGTIIEGVKDKDEGLETTFQTAGGRKMMITYDKKGQVVRAQDLGSAYKGDGAGGDGSTGQGLSPVEETANALNELKQAGKFTGQAADFYYNQELRGLAQDFGVQEGTEEYNQLGSILNQELDRLERGLTKEQVSQENDLYASDFEDVSAGEELGQITGEAAKKTGKLVGDKLKSEPELISEIINKGFTRATAERMLKKFLSSTYSTLEPFVKDFGSGFKEGVTQ